MAPLPICAPGEGLRLLIPAPAWLGIVLGICYISGGCPSGWAHDGTGLSPINLEDSCLLFHLQHTRHRDRKICFSKCGSSFGPPIKEGFVVLPLRWAGRREAPGHRADVGEEAGSLSIYLLGCVPSIRVRWREAVQDLACARGHLCELEDGVP